MGAIVIVVVDNNDDNNDDNGTVSKFIYNDFNNDYFKVFLK